MLKGRDASRRHVPQLQRRRRSSSSSSFSGRTVHHVTMTMADDGNGT